MGSRARIQLEEWLASLEFYGRVLDVGGSQNPLNSKRIGNFNASSYTILDLPEPHEKRVSADIPFDIQDDVDEGFGPGVYYQNYFDQVFCLEVAEYWHNPLKALKNINYFMRPGATLYISFHWLYGLHNPKGADCLRYSRNGIEKLMVDAGFEIMNMLEKDTTEQGQENLEKFYRMEGMRLDFGDRETYIEGYLVTAKKIIN